MKSKKFKKTLSLNKKTIVDLTGSEMNDAKGGTNDGPPPPPPSLYGSAVMCCASGEPYYSKCVCD